MSVTRNVDLAEVDFDILEDACFELGYTTNRNRTAKMYYDKTKEVCDLVIKCRNSNREIGFIKGKDKTTVMMDHIDGKEYGQVMSTYFERLIEKRTRGRYKLNEKKVVGNKMRISLRRVA
jgi:hypothetical protein